MLCSVQWGDRMEKGGEIYVDLRGEPDPNAAMMAMLRNLQQELDEIKIRMTDCH